MTPFTRALECVSAALSIPPEAVTGPAKGSGVIPRARALVAYLASTEGGVSDTDIAKALNRDRSSVSHMLNVIEAIREHPDLDSWIADLSARAINPPAPCDVTRHLLATVHAERAVEPGAKVTRLRDTRPLPASAEQALAHMARQWGLSARQLVSKRAPIAIRHAAWIALYATRTPHGGRYWTCERIASIAGVTRQAVARAIRQSTQRQKAA